MALIRSNLGRSFRETQDPRVPDLRSVFSGIRESAAPRHPDKMEHRLAALRRKVERIERSAPVPAAHLPFGLIEIDRLLPGAGLAAGAMHEVAAAAYGDVPAAFGFTTALAALTLSLRRGPAVLITARRSLKDFGTPYGHGLLGIGLDPRRLLLVESRSDKDALWALEETLKSKAAGMVLGAVSGTPDLTMSRRLSLAAASSGTPLVLLSSSAGGEPSAAMTRWRIAAAASGDRTASEKTEPFIRPRWHVALERCRNGRSGQWLLEWDHVAHRFHLAPGLADHTSHLVGHEAGRRLSS